MIITYYSTQSATNLSIHIGERVSFLLYRSSSINKGYVKNPKEDYKNWLIENNLERKKSMLKLGNYLINLVTNEPTAIFEIDINEDDIINTSSETIIKVSDKYIEIIRDNLILHPNSLPMLCPPNIWSDNKFGGFLENKNVQNDIVMGSDYHAHKLDEKNCIYDAVNVINQNKFSVNVDLLNYLKNDGNSILEKYIEDSKSKLQNEITLKIAEIYSIHPFYLNVNCDWRGRFYTNSFFLSYQGNDLARSLIQFENGEILNEKGIKFLYICGSNYFSKELNKKSYKDRIKWVDNNKEKIISLDKDLINQSKEKLQFLSFCLTMKKLNVDKNCVVKMPIFLDATCSGLQHLAAMLKDSQIGALVNLISKSEDESVSDIYEVLVNPINKEINKVGKNKNNNHPLLKDVKLTRDILKPSIMTTVYNVTISGIYDQLIHSKYIKK
jgi:DNA-directed RNA polymerase